MELVILLIMGLMVVLPILFVLWTLSRVRTLLLTTQILNNEVEMLNNKILKMAAMIRRLEEKSTASAAQSQNVEPHAQSPAQSPAQTQVFSQVQSYPQSQAKPHSQPQLHEPAQTHKKAVEKEIGDVPVASPMAARSRPSHEENIERRPTDEKKEWEAGEIESLIGGDYLNKIGAFLLLIGLGLFLKYSLSAMGPWAKLAAGALLGSLMLAWGIVQNKQKSGEIFAIGLIGGGWSCLYLTAYAAYDVEATKVLDSPIAAMLLLLTVAAGMIYHSLRFKSEFATGLAFIFSFVALFVSNYGLFSEVAAVLLTISMLVLSYRNSWNQLAVGGLIMAYIMMLGRLYWRVVPSELSVSQKLMFVQTMLIVTWATFELIGMNFLRRRAVGDDEKTPVSWLFLMNMAAYLGISLLAWPSTDEISLSYLTGAVVLQYLVSGLLRAFWCRTPGEAAVEKQSILLGSFEDCLVIFALSLCVWLWYVLPASVVVIGWALTGLLVIEIAFRMPWQFLRFSGHLIMTMTFFRVFLANFGDGGMTAGISHRLMTVMPLVVLMIHLYNRTDVEIDWESAPTGGTRTFAPVYSYFAVILLAFLIRFEFGPGLTAPLWAIAAVVLTLLGKKFANSHLARQGVLIAVGAAGYGFSTGLQNNGSFALLSNPWAIGFILSGALYVCRFICINEPVKTNDSLIMVIDCKRREIFSLTGSLILAFLLYNEISGGYLTLAWTTLGICLLIAGFYLRDRVFRLIGLGTVMICILKLFLYDARVLDAPLRILAFICLGGALILISWAYARFKEKFQELL